MTEESKPDAAKVIKEEGFAECGCFVTTYSDGSQSVKPCVPCGLMGAANALAEASQYFQTVAVRMARERDTTRANKSKKRWGLGGNNGRIV